MSYKARYEQRRFSVLIDTQWNVNYVLNSIKSKFIDVLIDTQWNVNFVMLVEKYPSTSVLIDTQWNVNNNLSETVDVWNMF